jgi:hypothetical protein
MLRLVMRLGGVLVGTVVACSVVNAPDEPLESDDDDGSGASSTTSSSVATGTGGAVDCQGPSDCAHLTSDCNVGACENGTCVADVQPTGTACGDASMSDCDQPDSCDDAGNCLANNQPDGTDCLEDLCAADQFCMAGQCSGGTPKDCSTITVGCSKGACDPNSGMCVTMTETLCMSGDNCCPGGCSPNNDTDCAPPTGTVRHVNGGTVNVDYVLCGSGAPGACTATAAKSSCGSIGRKVVSHASDGNFQVLPLGATESCLWSISYFTVNKVMPSSACLVGVSNLDWSSCCGPGSWHGNTVAFGAPSTIFGYVEATNSGYVSSYPNVTGSTWSCTSATAAAGNLPGCSVQYVACAL